MNTNSTQSSAEVSLRRSLPIAYIDGNGNPVTWRQIKREVSVGFEYFWNKRKTGNAKKKVAP